jgi:syntaxin 18
MADRTADFNACLQKHNAQPVTHHAYNIERINSFLQEAYSINARIADLTHTLRSTRPAYLSTAPPTRRRQNASAQQHQQHDHSRPLTHEEREAFDASSKKLLKQLNAAIKNLQQAEEVRNQTLDSVALSKRAQGGLGALGRWAAGGAATAKSPEEETEEARRKTIAAFRAAVLMFLEQRLGAAGKVQAEMMEVRIGREVERSKSALYKSRGGASIPYAQDEDANKSVSMNGGSAAAAARRQSSHSAAETNSDMAELTQEQLQLFESENADLLQYYEGQMEQISQAERSILEISELHGTLHANLAQQSEHIEQLVQESYDTTDNLGKGNLELRRASERRSTAQAVFWSTVGFCSFLVVWDLVF